jgi:predicted RNase H-like HicB family nuclease
MKTKIVVHEAEEGGFWAEVPAIPGCATQGDSMDELMQNLQEAIEGCLSIEVAPRTGWYRTDAGTACMKSLSGRDFARIINRAARLGLASRQWQPSYLWQKRQCRAAFNSDPRQQAIEDGPAAAFGEACRTFRRRSLAPKILLRTR